MSKPTPKTWAIICLLLLVGTCGGIAIYAYVVADRHAKQLGFAEYLENHDGYSDIENQTPRIIENIFGPMRHFDRIVELGIWGRPISQKEIELISSCRELRLLYLVDVQLTDTQLAQLDLPRVSELDLTGNRLTDQSLNRVLQFQDLEVVTLSGNTLDAEAIDRMRERVSSLEILY